MPQNVDDDALFVDSMTKLILESNSDTQTEKSQEQFPLTIRVDLANSSANQSSQELKTYLTASEYSWEAKKEILEVSLSSMDWSEKLVEYLTSKNWLFFFDYSAFSEHPGLLLAEPIQKAKHAEKDIESYFNSKSRFKSLSEISFIQSLQKSPSNTSAIVLKFDNFMDVSHILKRPQLYPNPFGSDKLLQLSRFHESKNVSKSQQEANLTTTTGQSGINPIPAESTDYDTIVIENLSDFLGGSTKLEKIEMIVRKIQLFHSVETVFFPATKVSAGSYSFKRMGYIKFSRTKDSMKNALNCLYYLNDLTLQQLLDFSTENIHDIKEDINKPRQARSDVKSATIKLVIAQRKHNHYIFQTRDSPFFKLSSSKKLIYSECLTDDFLFENEIVKNFTKTTNYQETNVYVNNFPILFENNDDLWADFWNQFGVDGIKSARIIKPQFYSKKTDEPLGKIGFVFYEDFRMALRAIIMTNNKIISYKDHHDILLQTSFAIQKDGNSISTGKMSSQKYSMNNRPFFSPSESFDRRLGYPMLNESFLHMDVPYKRNESPFASPLPFFSTGDTFIYNPYIVPVPYAHINTEDEAGDEGDSATSQCGPTNNMGNTNQFMAPMGYYYSYYPFSSPLHMGAIASAPIPRNLVPMHPNGSYSSLVSSNRETGGETGTDTKRK